MRLRVLIIVCISLFHALTMGAATEEEYREEIRMLQQRNAQLEDSLEQLTAELQQSDATMTMLKKEIAEMTDGADEQAQEVAETREAMKQVKEQLAALLAQQSETDVAALEQQLATAVQRAQQAENELKRAQSELQEQQKALARAQEQPGAADAPQLQAQIDALQTELEQQREQFRATVAMLQDRDADLTAANAKLEGLQERLRTASTDARVEELEAALADANAQLIALAAEKSKLESQAQNSSQYQQQLERKDAEIARLEGELRKAAEYINSRSSEIAALEDTKAEIQKRELGLERTVTELEVKLREMEGARNRSEARLSTLEAQNSDLQARLEALQSAKSELERQLVEAATTKSGLETRLTTSLEERSARIQQLEGHVQDLQSRIDTTEAKLREADKVAMERAEAVRELEAELQYQSSVPEAAKERIEELTLELQEVRSQFDDQETMKRDYPRIQQELASCQATMGDLVEEQDRCQAAQRTLRETLAGVQQERDRLEITLQEKLAEVDALSSRALQLQGNVENEADLRKSDAQTYRDTLERNRELEAQFAEIQRQLKVKEQVLQQTLTDKALLEKQVESSDGTFNALQTQLAQARQQYAELEQEVLTLRQARAQRVEAQHDTTTAQAMLQEQIQQERARRRQLEAELLETQKTVQALRQSGSGQAPVPVTREPLPAPVASAAAPQSALRVLFPQEILQSLPGSSVAILSISPNKRRIAYQETAGQTERLWMLNTGTRQVKRLLEWQRTAGVDRVMSRFAWAADEEHFLFSTGTPGGYGLYLGNSSGIVGKPVMLKDAAVHFAWAPQQLRFAYFSGSNLVVQEVGGAALPLQLGNASGGSAGTALAWSPDGRMLAFSVKRGRHFDIFTLTLSGAEPTIQSLVASPSDDIQPSWSPDGRHVAFYVRSAQHDTKLAMVPVDRSRAPVIIAHQVAISSADGPQWASTTRLVYVGAGTDHAVHTIDITTGQHSFAPLALVLEY